MKITEYRESEQVPVPNTRIHPVSAVRQSSGGVDRLFAGGMQALSVLARREEEDARAWSANALSEARLQWTQTLIDEQSNFQPGPGKEFTPGLLSKFDEYTGKALTTAPNESARRYLETRLNDLRADIGTKAMVFEAGARIDWRADSYKSAAQNVAKEMNTNPGGYQVGLAEWLATVNASEMPPVKKSEIREWGTNLISKAVTMSQIQRSPTEFLRSIGFGVPDGTKTATGVVRASSGDLTGRTGNTAFDALPFETRMQLFEHAIRAKAQIDSDADKASTALRKQIADTNMKEAWDRFYSGNLTLDFVQSIMPSIDEKDYKALRVALRAGPELRMMDDRDTVSTLTQMMYKDPDGAARFAHQAFQNGLLSVDTYRSEVSRANDLARTQGPKSPYERSRSFIAQALSPGEGMAFDPARAVRQADALRTFDNWKLRNPNAADADIQKRGDEILEQYTFIDLKETVIALPMPRGTTIRRTTDVETLRTDIAAAARRLQRMLESKQLTRPEYEEEMITLARWKRAAERGNK